MKTPAAVLFLLSAACAAPQTVPPACPTVPECRLPSAAVETNQDLARAYLGIRHELKLCKTARDTLAACLNPQESRP